MVYGGITPSFTHAYKTENFLVGQYIFDNQVLQGALHCLQSEINPVENEPDPSPRYKKKLSINLFYKVRTLSFVDGSDDFINKHIKNKFNFKCN